MTELIEKIIIFILILLVNILIVYIFSKIYSKKKKKHFQNIFSLYEKGLYKEAINEAKKIQIDGIESLIHEFIGDCYYELGDKAESYKHYKKAISIDNNSEIAHIELGKLLLDELKIDEALYHLQKALQIDAKNSVTRYYLSLAYEEKGNYEDAIRELEKAIKLTPTLIAYYERLYNIYEYLGKKTEADRIKRSLDLLKRNQGVIP